MKKSNYVTKYDYINYYVKQPSMWFFKNDEIESAYELQKQKALEKNSHDSVDLIDENYDDDEYQDDNSEEIENDDYDFYRSLLAENAEIDKNNPLIVSGIIIDKKSKEFVINEYKQLKQCHDFYICDFDEIKPRIDLTRCAEQTLQLLNQHENVILFQPVFIDKARKILTKCDALVKYQNEIYLIETKGTSTAKFHHFLDLFFQKQILEVNLDPKVYDMNYQLCLVRYEYLSAKQISFIISDTINLSKNVTSTLIKASDLSTKQLVRLGASYTKVTEKGKSKDVVGVFINDLLNLTEEFINNKKAKKRLDCIKEVTSNFDIVIKELWDHKTKLDEKDVQYQNANKILFPSDFLPHKQDKSIFKDTDLWQKLRPLYALKGFEQFKYSGNIIDQNANNLEEMRFNYLKNYQVMIEKFIKGTPETKQKRFQLFFAKTSKPYFVDKKNYNNVLKKLKPKRVYFDFESINPAIRVVDKSLPFMQIVTQCSILVDHGSGIEPNCNNLMADPSNLSTDFFKQVVDSLYHGGQYCYIVYNKSFERLCLRQMIDFINEPSYTDKINIIIDNLFDLADFFRVNKDEQTLFIRELKGFYSIKKVLPLVEKYAPELFIQTNCQSYYDLEIGNGVECQSKSLQRFYGVIDDQDWANIVTASKKYCENDVRAMVAVLYWALKLATDPNLPHY